MIDAGDPRYRLRRDGTGDNAEAFARIMADAQSTQQGVALPPGRYQTSHVAGFSGLSLIGESRATTVIGLHPSMPQAELFGVAGDEVAIRGICFDGQSLGPRQDAQLVGLIGARIRMIECAVQNVPYIGLALMGRDIEVVRCYFTHTGKLEVTPEGGAAIWIGGSEESPTQAITIDGCLFEDLEWSSIYSNPQLMQASDIRIIRCTSRRTKESCFFLYGSPRLLVDDCTIEDVSVKNISASGIETGGTCALTRNKIRRTQAQAISLQHAIGAIVSENELTMGGSITHLSIAFDPVTAKLLGPPRNTQIKSNVFDGTPAARIWFGGQDGAPRAHGFITVDNVGLYAPDEWGGVHVDDEFKGENFFVDRNLTTDTLA